MTTAVPGTGPAPGNGSGDGGAGSDGGAGLLRELDRVADRLRILGPRWTARLAAVPKAVYPSGAAFPGTAATAQSRGTDASGTAAAAAEPVAGTDSAGLGAAGTDAAGTDPAGLGAAGIGTGITAVLGPLEQVREVLQVLADLAADAGGGPHRLVPRLAPHALADQVLVLGHELAAAGDEDARAAGTAALAGLRRVL